MPLRRHPQPTQPPQLQPIPQPQQHRPPQQQQAHYQQQQANAHHYRYQYPHYTHTPRTTHNIPNNYYNRHPPQQHQTHTYNTPNPYTNTRTHNRSTNLNQSQTRIRHNPHMHNQRTSVSIPPQTYIPRNNNTNNAQTLSAQHTHHKPQSRSQSMPVRLPWKRIKFKINNNHKPSHKRTFMDSITDNHTNEHRKRRKLSPNSSDNHSFISQCSIPYQSLVNSYKWKKKQFCHKNNTNPNRIKQETNVSGNTKKKKKKKRSKCDYDYFYKFLIDSNSENNKLQNTDFLIAKWDAILSGMSLEIMRNLAKIEFQTSDMQKGMTNEWNKYYEIITNHKNKYFEALKKYTNKADTALLKQLMHKNLYRFNRHLGFINSNALNNFDWYKHARLHSLYSYIAIDHNQSIKDSESMVVNDMIKYNAVPMHCCDKLFLWPNGFSYHTMDNYHSYDKTLNLKKFVSFIDQLLIPMQWINDMKRDLFYRRFFKQHQMMRLQRSKMSANHANNKYKNKNDTESVVIHKFGKGDSDECKSTYFEGYLLLELYDFRYVSKDSKNIDAYQYKQSVICRRLLLNGNGYLCRDFADLPKYFIYSFKGRYVDEIVQKLYNAKLKRERKLCETYPFYFAFKQSQLQKYKECLVRYCTLQKEMSDLYQIYFNLKRLGQMTMAHNLNWFRMNKSLKKYKTELIELYHLQYCSMSNAQKELDHKDYSDLRKYQSLNESQRPNLMNSANKNKANNKEIMQRLHANQQRITKCLSNPVIRNKVESLILLALFPDLCLQPSLKVMQVLNYAHYSKNQKLVRSQFNDLQFKKDKNKCFDQNVSANDNLIIEGIDQSQKFLHCLSQNGNEKLFKILESQRNATPYLYDKGYDFKANEFKEPRKHPGYCVPKYSKQHYETKCIVLKNKKYLINLRIDYLPSESGGGGGLWLFTVHQKQHYEQAQINYKWYINHCASDTKHINYSQECLTLNSAAKLWQKHLRFELYQNNAKIVFSQNTKFDSACLSDNNLKNSSNPNNNSMKQEKNMNDTNEAQQMNKCGQKDIFQIL